MENLLLKEQLSQIVEENKLLKQEKENCKECGNSFLTEATSSFHQYITTNRKVKIGFSMLTILAMFMVLQLSGPNTIT